MVRTNREGSTSHHLSVFSDYMLGQEFTDHKFLCWTVSLDAMPPRVVRIWIRLANFVTHVPGKFLYKADALSRAPIPDTDDPELEEEMQAFVDGITQSSFLASKGGLEEYQEAQDKDPLISQVHQYCMSEWPDKKFVSHVLIPYYQLRSNLTVCNVLLLYSGRIVVPWGQTLHCEN